MNDAVPMIRPRIERIELQDTSGIVDVIRLDKNAAVRVTSRVSLDGKSHPHPR
jgi:hypothetical protein